MGKFGCLCGNVISDVEYPCKWTGQCVGDVPLEEAEKELTKINEDLSSKSLSEQIQIVRSTDHFTEQYTAESTIDLLGDLRMVVLGHRERSLLECEECGRLWVQKSPFENQYIGFRPEDGSYHGVLKG